MLTPHSLPMISVNPPFAGDMYSTGQFKTFLIVVVMHSGI